MNAIAFRCDGDAHVGGGHVARCIPLAGAFADLGWRPVFVGMYSGIADWLLRRSGLETLTPDEGPCGLADGWSAAVIDSYTIPGREVCAAAKLRPTVTLAEARRCEDVGVVLDYHVDAPSPDIAALPSERIVAGPQYAPLEAALAKARRRRTSVERVLVTVGGTAAAQRAAGDVRELVAREFPAAALVALPGAAPTALVDVLPDVDLAVSAAGVTAYELACAGVPALVVAIVENQRRVARACNAAGIAVGVDGLQSDAASAMRQGLARLADPDVRASLAAAGPRVFDGHGAERAAREIERRWKSSG